ncbi:MAG: universal stress protein [Austwickia sp.]|jgi:nucleotide-binding universal stress UspA family protein|nr:universal stress protein [Austwickia sp.]MBK8435189.1 universal stress protein [Austwickia sp.]MBK9101257.1 universal stress protein [Austwickia sp.]
MTGAPLGNGGTARQSPTTPDVVAGMPFGPLAPSVARAAVHEAVRYGARVRFLQVLQAGTSDQARAGADDQTFSAALRALREAPRVRVAFETVVGEAEQIFVERSREAVVLVVAGGSPAQDAGEDRFGAGAIAEYCLGHAGCPVLVVER